jgi:glycosyltransferase involved in cell wall biosynthesis
MSPPTRTTEPADQVRVLALIDHFVQGGAETLLSRFAVAAPEAGIELSVACLEERDGNPAAAPLRDHGIELVNLDLVGRPDFRALRTVRAHIARVRPQLVHTHLGSSDLLGCVAARSLAIPAVSTIHTTLLSERRREWVSGCVVGRCADRVIAVSESARQEYLRHPGWGRNVVTIHNGIDVSAEPGSGARVREELGIAPDDLVVTMASALRPEKGHDIALEALRILRPSFPNLKLLILGQGALRDAIAGDAEDLGSSVVMVGFKPDVMPYLAAADICLQPSLREAFPTTLIEAMAARTPIVASAVGGIPEIITGPELGVLVPAPPSPSSVADALRSLLEHPERRQALASAGQDAYQRRFTAAPWVHRTRALYDQILVGRRDGQTRDRRYPVQSLRARVQR